MRAIGVFGGTFDPPHHGHLLAASDAYEALDLSQVRFVPAARPPFKRATVVASGEQRARMLELLIGGDPRFVVDRSELFREGVSYTVDTLAALAEQNPGASLTMLIGQDLAKQIATWRDAARIKRLARIVVLPRAGGTRSRRRVATRRVDISSTEIRARVRAGKPITGFVPESVARFIRDEGLYR